MKKKFSLLIILLMIILVPFKVQAEEKQVNVYVFWGDGCPHCAAEDKWLKEYEKDNDNIKVYKYEVWYNTKNQGYLKSVQKKLDNHDSGVPLLVVGDNVIVGFAEGITEEKIKKRINECIEDKNYVDYVGDIVGVKTDYSTDLTPSEYEKEIKKGNVKELKPTNETVEKVNVPLMGKVNPKTVSLPLLATVLGFIDGFNPCSMWILIFLITMLFNMKDRKKMWILGITFIVTSGIVYLAFMLAWLSLATFISKLSIIKLCVAAVAIVVGIWNLVKFSNSIIQKDEGCDVVDSKDRKKIMDRIKSIVKENRFYIALIGIILLAASVNIIELMCSIGIPLIFTQIISMNDLSTFEYGLYIFIYIFFFLLDDIIVFALAMRTKKIVAISTKYSKYSHLLAGILMILIGILLVIKPELLMFS